jgi:hypothetical protein
MLYSLVAFVVALAFARADYTPEALADEVVALPGLEEVL